MFVIFGCLSSASRVWAFPRYMSFILFFFLFSSCSTRLSFSLNFRMLLARNLLCLSFVYLACLGIFSSLVCLPFFSSALFTKLPDAAIRNPRPRCSSVPRVSTTIFLLGSLFLLFFLSPRLASAPQGYRSCYVVVRNSVVKASR